MKVLVIHPSDPTTDFLSVIYQDRTDWTVIRTGIEYGLSKKSLKDKIKEHDAIIMMGHGTKYGLADGDFNVVVDSNFVYLLREKITVGIWCNADEFYKKYDLMGLCTGMIISEYMEANLYCVNGDYAEIEQSNRDFARAVRDNLDLDNLYQSVIRMRGDYQVINEVTQFNNDNIYCFE